MNLQCTLQNIWQFSTFFRLCSGCQTIVHCDMILQKYDNFFADKVWANETLYLWERVPRITRGSNARFCIGGRNLVDLGAVLSGSRFMFSCWSRGLSYLGLSLLPLLNRGSISRRPISFAVGPLDPILTTFPDHTPISPKNLKYLHCRNYPTWVQIM